MTRLFSDGSSDDSGTCRLVPQVPPLDRRKLAVLALLTSLALMGLGAGVAEDEQSLETEPRGGRHQTAGRAAPAGGRASSAQPTPPDWVQHNHESGVSIRHPRGWRQAVDPNLGVITLAGPSREQIVAWPIFVRGELNESLGQKIVTRLARRLEPHTQWQAPESVGRQGVRAASRAGGRRLVASLIWVRSQAGSAGWFYLVSAAEADFQRQVPTFARVLERLRILGQASGPSQETAPAVAFVRWQDPNESAFALEVPANWRAAGGLARHSAVDTRLAVEAVSPDGQIRVYHGDAEIPPYSLPHPMLEAAGFTEGSWYSPGFGVRLKVLQYLPGAEFAQSYVTHRRAAGASDLKFHAVRQRPDASQSITTVYQRLTNGSLRLQFDAGEAAYTCTLKRQPVVGYAFAGTVLSQAQDLGNGMWAVDCNYGYQAVAARAREAEVVLARMVRSYKLSPEWVRMQTQLGANVSRIVTETGHYVADLIDAAYQYRSAVTGDAARKFSNAILEIEDTLNPVTGDPYQVESGKNYYWIDQRGNIVGTDTYTRPDINFQELIRLP